MNLENVKEKFREKGYELSQVSEAYKKVMSAFYTPEKEEDLLKNLEEVKYSSDYNDLPEELRKTLEDFINNLKNEIEKKVKSLKNNIKESINSPDIKEISLDDLLAKMKRIDELKDSNDAINLDIAIPLENDDVRIVSITNANNEIKDRNGRISYIFRNGELFDDKYLPAILVCYGSMNHVIEQLPPQVSSDGKRVSYYFICQPFEGESKNGNTLTLRNMDKENADRSLGTMEEAIQRTIQKEEEAKKSASMNPNVRQKTLKQNSKPTSLAGYNGMAAFAHVLILSLITALAGVIFLFSIYK